GNGAQRGVDGVAGRVGHDAVDGEERHVASALRLAVDALEDRQLLPARHAPRRPEVEDDDAAAQLLRGDRAAVDEADRERDRPFRHVLASRQEADEERSGDGGGGVHRHDADGDEERLRARPRQRGSGGDEDDDDDRKRQERPVASGEEVDRQEEERQRRQDGDRRDGTRARPAAPESDDQRGGAEEREADVDEEAALEQNARSEQRDRYEHEAGGEIDEGGNDSSHAMAVTRGRVSGRGRASVAAALWP